VTGQTISSHDHGSDLQFQVELRGFEPLIPSMRTMCAGFSREHFAAYTGTSPVEVSSGERKAHRCRCVETGASSTPYT
jgi:hypothetical protein